jgi:hypothetical protein
MIVGALEDLGNVVRRRRAGTGLIDGATGEIENPMTYKYATEATQYIPCRISCRGWTTSLFNSNSP